MGMMDLTYGGLAVGMLLMLIPFYFLWRFRTGLLQSAVWGTVRMTVQVRTENHMASFTRSSRRAP